MSNLLDYLDWRGDISFKKSSANKIDYLMLAQISYVNFDGLLKTLDFSKKLSLKELKELFLKSTDIDKRRDTGALINPLTIDLFEKAAESERFSQVEITGYQSIVNQNTEEQFAAMTFILPDGDNFIAFRGTDDNIVAWKEDFNLAFMDEIPAQKDSVDYILKAYEQLTGNFTIGGHSKGGNLSIYSVLKTYKKIKKRFKDVYNFDGPGFSDERLSSKEFKEIIPHIKSYYPQFSIVGMLFSNAGEYEVIKSSETLVMQHDPFSWHILGKNFVTLENFDLGSKFFHTTFNTWLSEMDNERRALFIETLFDIINVTDAKTNSEIEKNIAQNSVKILTALSKLDPDLRKKMTEIVANLFKSAQKTIPNFFGLKQ